MRRTSRRRQTSGNWQNVRLPGGRATVSKGLSHNTCLRCLADCRALPGRREAVQLWNPGRTCQLRLMAGVRAGGARIPLTAEISL